MNFKDFMAMMEAREDLVVMLNVIGADRIVAIPDEWINAIGRPLWDDYPPQRFSHRLY